MAAKKMVLKLDLHDNKEKQKALEAVSTLPGLTTRTCCIPKPQVSDGCRLGRPRDVVLKLRKLWPAQILSVGPAKEEKKAEGVKKCMDKAPASGDKKDQEGVIMVYPRWYKAPASASLGAMGPLLEKLDVLLAACEDDPGRALGLPKGIKDGVHHLKVDLEEIIMYLEDLSEVENPPLTAKCWMKEVRELSYDIEDYMDSFAQPGRSANIKGRSFCKIGLVKITRLPEKKLKRRKGVADMISEFRIRAQEAIERHERYDLDCHTFRRRYASVGPMLPTPYEEGADLVIDGRTSEFIDSLANDGDEQLRVVSIVGSGGMGKTTLVRVLYNKLRGQFDCRAFVRMTRNVDIKNVLRDMLTQLQRQHHGNREDPDLIGKIREHLQLKRYLIVIDDLWAASVWDIISHAFPEGSQRSRIITTTEIEDVALSCCSYHSEYVFEMKPLHHDHSRKLFFNRFFCSESDFPQKFTEVSNKIVEICDGLPLATISIASLLASHPVILEEQWTYICDSLSSILRTSSTSEGLRLVLNLSYNHLTQYLKTCLLYLNMYPEGCTVCKNDLVKQWVAEGFIHATEGRDVEKVAESYFAELIHRRFLQPACMKYDDEVVSCTVHDIVRDLIAYKSVEENFIMVVDYYRKNVELSDNVHRLSLHFGDAKYAKTPGNIRTSQVRSLTFFGLFKCIPSITEYKLLRVLNLQLSGTHVEDTIDLTGISELFQLRYLKVASDICLELPKHMRGLQYLETLDMDTKVTAVPWDIIHLPCLLHLHLPFETNLMDWIGTMRSASLQSLGKLTNLQDLRLTYPTPPHDHLERNMESLGSLLGGHANLKTLALVPGSSHKNVAVHGPSEVIVSWDGFTPPPLLQRFEWSPCSCTFSRVPKGISELGSLCVLKIAVRELLGECVDSLRGLPALAALSLYVQTAPVERIVFDKVGFPVLKYFKFRCRSVPWLKFEADAMPNLQKLKLGFKAHGCDQHGCTPISIEHLSGLKEISVKIGGTGADAESALTADVSNHPRNPRIQAILDPDGYYVTEDENSREDENKQANARISMPSGSYSHLPNPGLKNYSIEVNELVNKRNNSMVTASTGAMNCIVNKLGALMGGRYAKLRGMQKDVMIQKDELDSMNSLLEQLADTAELSIQMKDCRNQIRELTYDIVDCIDDLMVYFDKGINQGTGYPEKWDELQKLIDHFRSLIKQVEVAGPPSMVPKIEMCTLGSSYMKSKPRLSKVYDVECLVGINGPRDELVKWLIGGEQELQVVCIFGLLGIGKTTLATQVYNKAKWRFEHREFISMSKKLDIQPVINQLSVSSISWSWSRYLFVIDGVRSARMLEDIKVALPENNRGSRIIITTSISDVAESCGKYYSSSFIYRMEPLSSGDANRLFWNIIFKPRRRFFPTALEKVAEKIVKACCGVPLAITLIAGLLASKPAELAHWEMVQKGMELVGTDILNVAWMRKIFDISYSDLSRDMKTCLLYLSAFPEEHPIDKGRLIRRWAAEGFLPERSKENWLKIGNSYFQELITRKLVELVDEDIDIYLGLPSQCQVQGLVHDFIASLSSEENFVTSPTFMQHDVIRRISVSAYDNNRDALVVLFDETRSINLPKIQSFTVLVSDYSDRWGVAVPDLSAFIHVRVLDLEGTMNLKGHHLRSVGSLSLLRYLGLVGTNVSRMPENILALDHLLTLDLRETRVSHLPEFRSPKLVSLFATDVALSRGMEEMQELEELSQIRVSGDSSLHDAAELVNKLKRLRLLGVSLDWIYGDTEIDRQGVVHFLGEVRKSSIQSLVLDSYPAELLYLLLDCWAHARPRHLELFELNISGWVSRVPEKVAFLVCLTHLKVGVDEIEAEGIRALGNLPNLVFLDLESRGQLKCIITKDDGFHCLKVFYNRWLFYGMGLKFELGAMPQLRMLKLQFKASGTKYGKSDFGIQNLSCLVQVSATISCWAATASDVEAAEAAIVDQVSENPNNPVLELIREN